MDNKTLGHYKKLLLNKKSKYINTKELMNEHSESEQGMSGASELSNYDNHPADLGSEVFELGLNNALIIHDKQSISDIDDALSKIENGLYGLCEFCGNPISKERLDALPFATLCIECENSREVDFKDIKTSRPSEEIAIGSPFGHKNLNSQDDDEYEGLDILNDLMKQGSSDSPQDMGGYKDYKDFYTNDTDNQGIVEDVEKYSNDDYKRGLQ